MDKIQCIMEFLQTSQWVKGEPVVEFLAAGEYNENYLVREQSGRTTVFRINHGSQLGLDNQIEYEFKTLKAIEASGVTPKPYEHMAEPGAMGSGVLLMEYLPGSHLEYEKDYEKAAVIFSKIHALEPSPDLIVQSNPVFDIAGESLSLITRQAAHPLFPGISGKLVQCNSNRHVTPPGASWLSSAYRYLESGSPADVCKLPEMFTILRFLTFQGIRPAQPLVLGPRRLIVRKQLYSRQPDLPDKSFGFGAGPDDVIKEAIPPSLFYRLLGQGGFPDASQPNNCHNGFALRFA